MYPPFNKLTNLALMQMPNSNIQSPGLRKLIFNKINLSL